MQLCFSALSHSHSAACRPRFGHEKHWGKTVAPDRFPNTLQEFDRRLKSCHPDFTNDKTYCHDMLAHILGGGLPTPAGEVFGELMQRVLSTPQRTSKQWLWPNYKGVGVEETEDTWIDHKDVGTLIVPRFETFMKEGQSWENDYCWKGRMQSSERLSEEQFKELYGYAIELLAMYIQRWGKTPDKSILGEKTGYRSVVEVSKKALNLKL